MPIHKKEQTNKNPPNDKNKTKQPQNEVMKFAHKTHGKTVHIPYGVLNESVRRVHSCREIVMVIISVGIQQAMIWFCCCINLTKTKKRITELIRAKDKPGDKRKTE